MLLQSWLNLVCQMLPKVRGAVLVAPAQEKAGQKPIACWPEGLADDADLLSAVPLAANRNSPVFSLQKQSSEKEKATNMLVAYPLLIDKRLFAILALELEADSSQQHAVSQLLQWAQAWLQLVMHSRYEGFENSSAAITALDAGLQFNKLQESLTAAASRLAQDMDCARVSIGLCRDDGVQVTALSHSAVFDGRANLVRSIEEAMEETHSQRRTVTSSLRDNEGTNPAHIRLNNQGKQDFLCSVPLLDGEEPLGVLMFERSDSPFDKNAISHCEEAAKIISTLLLIKDRKNSNTGFNLAVKNKLEQLFKPGHLKLKITAVTLLLLGLILAFGEAQYRVRAPALLEGSIQRAVVAPFEGYVTSSFARAGETVKAGEIIAELDDRELKLEQRRWLGQRDEFVKQYRQALADLDYVQAKIFKAQIAQADAQLAMLKDNLQRSRLASPLDGIIISGDLSRSLDAPVERGQVLFEVAPLNEYRLVLMVDEREIRELAVGQKGKLTLSSLPGQEINFEIERVATLFQEQDNRIIYRTEARLDTDVSILRPGMQGVGKVEIEQRRIGWILFHRLFDWLRFELWSWLP